MKSKKVKVKNNNTKKIGLAFTVFAFSAIGIVVLVRSFAATGIGIKPATNPKMALGVGGVTRDSFAAWLDRKDEKVIYSEINKHFSPDVETTLGFTTDNTVETTVITFALTPDNTVFLKNPNPNLPAGCKSVSHTDKGLYKGLPVAINNLGNANSDKNANTISDNIENLYHTSIGCYDNTFENLGDAIVRTKAYLPNANGTPKFIIRLGHEHNGNWYEWSSNNQTGTPDQINKALALTGGKTGEQLYVESFRRAHKLITERVKTKSGNPNAKVFFEWNGTSVIANGNTLTNTYPGNNFVDIIGIDFYDRLVYGNVATACYLLNPNNSQLPDCRTQTEKTKSWAEIKKNLDIISNFASSKRKLIGVSEVNNSATLRTIGGSQYWTYGLDNADFVRNVYNWTKSQTDKRKLAYIIFFERNTGNVASKETGGARGFQKLTPGFDGTQDLPATDPNVACSLSWNFGTVNGTAVGTLSSAFPKATTEFLKLWSGPAKQEAIKGSHPNCKKIGVI